MIEERSLHRHTNRIHYSRQATSTPSINNTCVKNVLNNSYNIRSVHGRISGFSAKLSHYVSTSTRAHTTQTEMCQIITYFNVSETDADRFMLLLSIVGVCRLCKRQLFQHPYYLIWLPGELSRCLNLTNFISCIYIYT